MDVFRWLDDPWLARHGLNDPALFTGFDRSSQEISHGSRSKSSGQVTPWATIFRPEASGIPDYGGCRQGLETTFLNRHEENIGGNDQSHEPLSRARSAPGGLFLDLKYDIWLGLYSHQSE